MFAVPSCSIVAPTSDVLPPSATTTPVTSWPANTLSTSALFVTEPCVTATLSPKSAPSEMPPADRGAFNFSASRTTGDPLAASSAWYRPEPVPPEAPKTAIASRRRAASRPDRRADAQRRRRGGEEGGGRASSRRRSVPGTSPRARAPANVHFLFFVRTSKPGTRSPVLHAGPAKSLVRWRFCMRDRQNLKLYALPCKGARLAAPQHLRRVGGADALVGEEGARRSPAARRDAEAPVREGLVVVGGGPPRGRSSDRGGRAGRGSPWRRSPRPRRGCRGT